MAQLTQDLVTIVTPQDEVIGELDKFVAHRYPSQLHRASSVWMIDERGALLFQKRSDKKIVGAGWWGNTICGNVWPAESYEACARRRLTVELGIAQENAAKLSVEPLLKFHYKAYANQTYGEHEIDQVYVSRVRREDVGLNLNPDEVAEVLWVDQSEFFTELDKKLLDFTHAEGRPYPVASQTVAMTFDELKRWTKPIELELAGEKRVFVPWTLLMGQLAELREALKK